MTLVFSHLAVFTMMLVFTRIISVSQIKKEREHSDATADWLSGLKEEAVK